MSVKKEKEGKMILWVDGCFDMFHYGHANVMRQAKEIFPNSYLIVGVHSDEAILRNKGPTVMNDEERYKAVAACKWVDEVYEDAPYTTSIKILNELNVKYCLHGDDVSTDCTGNNSYREVIAAGKYYTVPRTRGVSTTNILRRLLFHSKEPSEEIKNFELTIKNMESECLFKDEDRIFFPSVLQIQQYSDSLLAPKKGQKVVYVDGTFDLFHLGHVEFLENARKQGDYLIVGVHDDETVKTYKGEGFPILNLIERVLGVLSCRHVNNVIVGAPFCITLQLISLYSIDLVVSGSANDVPMVAKKQNIDPYEVARSAGVFKQIRSSRLDLNISSIIKRVVENSKRYIERNKKKGTEKEIFNEIDGRKEKEKKEEPQVN